MTSLENIETDAWPHLVTEELSNSNCEARVCDKLAAFGRDGKASNGFQPDFDLSELVSV